MAGNFSQDTLSLVPGCCGTMTGAYIQPASPYTPDPLARVEMVVRRHNLT